MRIRSAKPSLPKLMRWTAFLAAMLGTFACGGTDDADPEVVERPALDVEAEMRIDGHAEVLVPVGWIGVAEGGTTVLLQTQAATLRLFDREGQPIGHIGGRGQGPGEFEGPLRAGWKGDSLWVSDQALGRISVFTSELSFGRVTGFPTEAVPRDEEVGRLPRFPFVFPYAVYPGDTVLLSGQWRAGDPIGERMEGLPILLRAAPDGIIHEVVLEVPRNEGSINVTHEGGVVGAVVPFFPRPLWTVSPDGRRIATVTTHPSGVDSGFLHLRVVDEHGQVMMERRIPFDPVPIPSHVTDSALRAVAQRIQSSQAARVVEQEAQERMLPVYPPVHTLLIGYDHRVWLGLRATEEGTPWLVLDPDADQVARLLLPSNQVIRAADAEYLWVTERDELDVESVIRYRLIPG